MALGARFSFEELVDDAKQMLFTGRMRAWKESADAYALQYGVTPDEVEAIGERHLGAGTEGWAARCVNELAWTMGGDKEAASTLFQLYRVDRAARQLAVDWRDIKLVHEKKLPATQLSDMEKKVVRDYRALVHEVTIASGDAPQYAQFLVNAYQQNLRQHMQLESRISRS
jgi:hypothetical protein